MPTQEEIWEKHLKNKTFQDVILQYREPAIFQKELVQFICSFSMNCPKVIEVGCETGVTSMLLPKSYSSTLLDLNPKAIELCKAAHSKINKTAEFIVADMFDMPLADDSYDIVFNAGVIEHFNKVERVDALKEYSRILKNDGKLIIAFPNHYSLPYRLAYFIRRFIKKWPYPSEFKLFDLKEEIFKANLKLENRVVLSKGSLFRWLNFIPPLKWFFQLIDKHSPFEGYLTVLVITKVN